MIARHPASLGRWLSARPRYPWWVVAAVAGLVVLRPHPATGSAWLDVFACDIVLSAIMAAVFVAAVVRGASIGVVAVPLLLAATLGATVLLQKEHAGAQRAATLLYLIAMLQMLVVLTASTPSGSRVLRGSLHVLFSLSLAVAIMQATGIDPFGLVSRTFGTVKLKPLGVGHGVRVYGSYYNANWAGCAACCWMSIIWLESLAGTLSPSRSAALLLLALGLLVLTGSRSAAIAASSLALFSAGGLLVRHRALRLALLAAAALLATLLAMPHGRMLLQGVVSPRWLRLADPLGDPSVVDRLDSWRLAWDAWRSSPWVGVGRLAEGELPHNALLGMLCAVGLIGTASTGAALCVVLARPAGRTRIRSWWIGTLCSMALMFSTGDYVWSTQVALTVTLVLCAGATEPAVLRGSRVRSQGVT